MARLFSIRPALTLRGRRFRGLRGWTGKPTHPPLTDLPVAAYVFAAAFDLLSFVLGQGDTPSDTAHEAHIAATYVLIAGALISFPTALTGFWDWWKGLDRDRSKGVLGRAKHTQVWRTANWHMAVMLTVTLLTIVNIRMHLANWDEGITDVPVLIVSVLAGALVAFGALYGGALVYEYQFNVESLKGSTVWDETEQDQFPGKPSAPPAP
ncbi:MAG TPA: DUF2231 domain-containing protein [Actinomycetota bacterium]|nr:DUF2231 domain-containing protein [Actinomycetota bacterium]